MAMPDTNGLLLLVTTYIQWNPVNTVTDGPKKLTVLTDDRINEVFFFTRKCMAVLPGGQTNVAVITR